MKILACVAEVSDAERSVRLADTIARLTQSSLTFLHIVPPKGDRAAREHILELARERGGRLVEARVRRGSPAAEILAELDAGNYDLVLVGANRSPGLKEYLLGSVAMQVVNQAPISVLVAKRVSPPLERILICSSGAEAAERVIESGACLAEAADAQVTLLHVVTPVPSMYTGLGEIDEGLSELLQTDTPIARHLRRGAEILERSQVDADLKLRYGVAADEIIREARSGDYDLIVIGAAKRKSPLRWALGDVTREVVEKATRSVLVVRQGLVL